MPKHRIVQLLLSGDAVKAHLACAIVSFIGVSILSSEPDKRDEGLGVLLFGIVTWPVLLAMMYLYQRSEQREALANLNLAVSDPEKLRQKRRFQRRVMHGFLFVGAVVIVLVGHFAHVEVGFLPVQYLGYFLLAFGVAGLFGVNIWHRGPLDPRNDPPEDDRVSGPP